MSHRTRLAGAWTLLLALAVTSCSDSSSPTGPGQGPGYTPVRVPQPNTTPIVLYDNVVAIDSTVLRMVSSETEVAAGTYRFDVIGSPVPLIDMGDVIAGPEGLGFMGIATSVAYGSQVIVRTTQATLSDIIKEGSLVVDVPLDFSVLAPPPGSAEAPLYYLAPGVRPSVRLFDFDVENVDLCKLVKLAGQGACPEWLSLTLPSGYVDLDANLEHRLKRRSGFRIDTFKMVIKGGLVFDVTAKAVASKAFSTGGEVVLVTIPVPLPLPWRMDKLLKTKLLVSLKAGFEANAAAEANIQSGIHLETGVTMGGTWTYAKWQQTSHDTGWDAIWDPTFSAEPKETSWVAQGSGSVRVYIRPDVQFVMSNLEGPRAGLEPYLKVYGAVGTEECQMRLTRGTDANAELFAHFLHPDFSSDTVKVPWPGTETDVIDPIPCPIGHLKVETTTTGLSPGPDGYTVTLDGGDPKPITSTGSVMYSPLKPTVYSVELSGIADNCTTSVNPRDINVSEGDTTLVSFPVVCTDPAGSTGSLQVNATTTGQDDGYTAVADNDLGAGQALTVNGSTTFAPLTSGNHSVELTNFGSSCVVEGDNPRTVTIVQDATVETDFVIACGLTVTVATTGTDLDPDGYSVVVDGGAPTALADINGSLWLDIAPGVHSVELTGVADNCFVSGDNPRNINAPGEESFDVTCVWGSAITFVRDHNVWQINPDGTGEQQLTTDGAVQVYGSPNWSPDGSRMAFTRSQNCGTFDGDCTAIFASDADGSNIVQVSFPVTDVSDWGPDWSPDGARIVFWRYDRIDDLAQFKSIMTVNPDGTGLIEVLAGDGATSDYEHASWTPDGRLVYVERVRSDTTDDGFIAIMNADGSGSQRLTSTLGTLSYQPQYSPEEDRIAFRRRLWATQTFFDLMVMDADGSNLTNLSNQTYAVGSLKWSPDGSQIAYDRHTDAFGVWLTDFDGSNQTQLIPSGGSSPAWRTLP